MNEIEQTLERLKRAVRSFHEAGIDFVLIGGLAMRAHGANNMTTDADFAYAIEPDNLERLAAFLPTIHARVIGRPRNENFVITTDTLRKVRFLNLDSDLGAIDVMRDIAGIDSLEGLRARATLMDLGGFVVPVASIDDLIAMKRAANRVKDQSHIYELLALKKLIEAEPA